MAISNAPATATTTPHFTLTCLTPHIGAAVTGLDLSQPIGDAAVAALRQAWLDHHVLVFRDQKLTEDGQVRFARHFGEPVGSRSMKQANPHVMLISNIREDGQLIGQLPDGELQFHTDSVFLEKPLKGAILHAIEVPSTGGNTMFTSTRAAYDALPRDEQRRLSGLSALNAFDYETQVRTGRFNTSKGPHWTHPVIRTHPESGRKGIFVNRLMTQYIVGVPAKESDMVLARLWEICERREFMYEHVWQSGDVLMWDNRCTQHARADFPPDQRRLLRRVGLQGDKPY
jgi:taurine dioxygenase